MLDIFRQSAGRASTEPPGPSDPPSTVALGSDPVAVAPAVASGGRVTASLAVDPPGGTSAPAGVRDELASASLAEDCLNGTPAPVLKLAPGADDGSPGPVVAALAVISGGPVTASLAVDRPGDTPTATAPAEVRDEPAPASLAVGRLGGTSAPVIRLAPGVDHGLPSGGRTKDPVTQRAGSGWPGP